MYIGKQIKMLRLQKNVKQDVLAEYLGVSYQAVSKWETEMSVPDVSLLPRIATYFGVAIDELFQIPNEEQFERIENMFCLERRIKKEAFEQAVSFLEGVLKGEPNNVRAYKNLAYLYNHRAHSDHERASEYAKKVLALDENNKEGWVAYLEANGGVCGDEWYDNHFEVIEYFKDFLGKNPHNFLGLYGIIENLLADHRYEEAVPYIQTLKKVKNNQQYYVYMGDVAYGKGNLDEAKRLWSEAVEKYPTTWQAYCDRADRYKNLGMTKEALEDYETSYTMQNKPRIADGLYGMAQIYETLGAYKEAIKTRERIIQCLKEDYQLTTGEQVEEHNREIDRLRKLDLNKANC